MSISIDSRIIYVQHYYIGLNGMSQIHDKQMNSLKSICGDWYV